MTNTELDESLIGPLSASQIGPEPVRWGVGPEFGVADPETEAYVEREIERYRVVAERVVADEIRSLIQALLAKREPNGVLHGLIAWGPASAPKIAGFLGRTVSDVYSQLQALEFVGAVVQAGSSEFGEVAYAVDADSDIFGGTGILKESIQR